MREKKRPRQRSHNRRDVSVLNHYVDFALDSIDLVDAHATQIPCACIWDAYASDTQPPASGAVSAVRSFFLCRFQTAP